MSRAKTAVTLVTGYLGAGKTTLVNALVSSLEGRERVAVIVNEFGEVGIDGVLIAETLGSERVYELANGCLCCVVSGEFRQTLERVAAGDFTRVIVETSGAADPTSTLKLLWGAPELTKLCRLDAVVCVAAADRFEETVALDRVALVQASVADAVLLTKSVRAGAARVSAARSLVTSLNPAAAILEHDFSAPAPLDARRLLALNAYRKPAPAFVRMSDATATHGELSSIAVSWTGEVERVGMQAFFRDLAADDKVVRVKAILRVSGEPLPWLVHGVQSWFERGPAPKSYDGPNRLVILGRGCDSERIKEAIGRLQNGR